MAAKRPALVLVGTYSEPILFGTGQVLQGQGKGIHAFWLDGETGALTPGPVTEGVRNPSYLCVHPTRPLLYCVNEFKQFEGKASGAVSAFALDRAAGTLRHLNTKASHGTDPCHLMVDRSGRNVLVANFASGSVSVLPIEPDGSLAEASCVIQHQGSSIDPRRQAGPHAHAVEIDAANRWVFVPELGLDGTMIYALDAEKGRLTPHPTQPIVKVKPGAGPRQLVMHPNGRFAYLINELNSTMNAYAFDAAAGTLTELQSLPTLPAGFSGHSTCAEVQITPDGRFLYGSNRGDDSLAIYALDAASGHMTLVGHQKTGGRIPRNFTVSPDGRHIITANQDTNDLHVFAIDQSTGRPAPMGVVASVGTPVCVKLV